MSNKCITRDGMRLINWGGDKDDGGSPTRLCTIGYASEHYNARRTSAYSSAPDGKIVTVDEDDVPIEVQKKASPASAAEIFVYVSGESSPYKHWNDYFGVSENKLNYAANTAGIELRYAQAMNGGSFEEFLGDWVIEEDSSPSYPGTRASYGFSNTTDHSASSTNSVVLKKSKGTFGRLKVTVTGVHAGDPSAESRTVSYTEKRTISEDNICSFGAPTGKQWLQYWGELYDATKVYETSSGGTTEYSQHYRWDKFLTMFLKFNYRSDPRNTPNYLNPVISFRVIIYENTGRGGDSFMLKEVTPSGVNTQFYRHLTEVCEDGLVFCSRVKKLLRENGTARYTASTYFTIDSSDSTHYQADESSIYEADGADSEVYYQFDMGVNPAPNRNKVLPEPSDTSQLPPVNPGVGVTVPVPGKIYVLVDTDPYVGWSDTTIYKLTFD